MVEGLRYGSAERRRTPLWVVSLFLLCACGTLSGCIGKINLVSEPEEVALGDDLARHLAREIKFYRDPVVWAYVDSLGQMLARHSRRTHIPYHIYVVDTDDVNAFAIPGGHLYVNRGLITTAENESELAGVMGHEIGHVVGRHGAKALSKQVLFSGLAGLALGGDPGAVGKLAAGIVSTGALMHYGRAAENEADFFAIEELFGAGINPEGLTTFFEKLLALHKKEPSGLAKLFSTHPPTDERIKNVRAAIADLPPHPDLKRDSNRFHHIRDRLPPLAREKPSQ